MGSKRFFGGSKHAKTQVISMTSTQMMMPAPDSEHETPLWYVMFKNQSEACKYFHLQKESQFFILGTKRSFNRLNVSRYHGDIPPHCVRFPQGDRIVIFHQLEGRVMLCVCVCWCVASCTAQVADLPQWKHGGSERDRLWPCRILKSLLCFNSVMVIK